MISKGLARDIFITFGDSITELGYQVEKDGWVSQLANQYVRKIEVVNRGYSGKTTISDGSSITSKDEQKNLSENADNGKVNYEQQILTGFEESRTPRIRLVTIFLGANDSSLPPWFQHVPLAEYGANIRQMIDFLTNKESEYYNPDVKIILITPPPLCSTMWQEILKEKGYTEVNRNNQSVKIYADEVVKIGKDYNIPVINLWQGIEDKIQELKNAAVNSDGSQQQQDTNTDQKYCTDVNNPRFGYDRYLCDGLHLENLGNDFLFKSLMETINTNFPELSPENVPTFLPTWETIIP
ncbi:Isoamyl acetate-hydrolyzing esterase-like protein [Zancudomyces culisetae]|uniref:Isoamyl acetate-hydrolyzing esterase-like protein n=1 Tax=Zancudomyces culisetae TaxID=1213189 RepID=A0A1R1PUN5_ZANCU|nr:Isoamyl acetate-hydrolyzing esterase-like protein [Zancudomyces culisetae]|eukprot:OMH84688.1 Isoamyl acetate-hydrolyzing esterase-like protein [Zancudomyces culisetae]